MIPSRSLRTLATLGAVQLVATLALAEPAAAQGSPNSGTGPKLPPSGAIARDTAYERKVLTSMKAPEGFTMVSYAGPPFAMYPTVVAPAPDGSG